MGLFGKISAPANQPPSTQVELGAAPALGESSRVNEDVMLPPKPAAAMSITNAPPPAMSFERNALKAPSGPCWPDNESCCYLNVPFIQICNSQSDPTGLRICCVKLG